MTTISAVDRERLIAAARSAAQHSYAPYSQFNVGSALLFADGAIVTGTNIENASYGLALCAETIAVGKAMEQGRRGGLVAVAVTGSGDGVVTPCGRCRQILFELAALGGTDPVIWSCGPDSVQEKTLSELLPDAFGPGSL
ncbi:cytidine deaminase [Altericroceibacterium endophyticum]|uniref:Cytidine deaminase n=1 Tax=Altericroceibacterium endophyticum TaxID=1808508 RepID=A0A6I4T458_9SPHN|nr:cytidine deaminase [Altericroceibacterium endophyticum]MXO65119.1 cytidine deaminase [Altericroceibacterium endophyticum]